MKAKRNPVLSQLMAVSETSKYSAAVTETGANVNHYFIPEMLAVFPCKA